MLWGSQAEEKKRATEAVDCSEDSGSAKRRFSLILDANREGTDRAEHGNKPIPAEKKEEPCRGAPEFEAETNSKCGAVKIRKCEKVFRIEDD